jgi:hypothetical protein
MANCPGEPCYHAGMRDSLETLALLALAAGMGYLANVGCVPFDPVACYCHPILSTAASNAACRARLDKLRAPPVRPADIKVAGFDFRPAL